MYKYKYNKTLVNFSKLNRKTQTDAEIILWKYLRNKQLNRYKFRRQYPILNYVLDFYCVEKKLAIELDGSQHIEQEKYDDERSMQLDRLGIRVLRFWDNDALKCTEDIIEKILIELDT